MGGTPNPHLLLITPPPGHGTILGGRFRGTIWGDDSGGTVWGGRSEGDGPGETVFADGYIKQLSAKIRKNERKCATMFENAQKCAKMRENMRKCANMRENRLVA